MMTDDSTTRGGGSTMRVCCVVIDDNDLGVTANLDAIVSSVNDCNQGGCNIDTTQHTATVTVTEGKISGTISDIPYCSGYRYKIVFRKKNAPEGWYTFGCVTLPDSSTTAISFHLTSDSLVENDEYEVVVVPVAPNSECLHCPE
jgi:hypothetical protein